MHKDLCDSLMDTLSEMDQNMEINGTTQEAVAFK